MKLALQIAAGLLIAGAVSTIFWLAVSAGLIAAITTQTNAETAVNAKAVDNAQQALMEQQVRREILDRERRNAAADAAADAAAAEAQRQADAMEKTKAWTAYYTSPASCEHPKDWNDQVECGNAYMRAKRRFDANWATSH